MLEKGYNNTGIQEVLHELALPKGSFYHYFTSKEEFGLSVLELFVKQNDALFSRYMSYHNLTPLTRLRRYFEAVRKYYNSIQFRNGCLVGNFSQELADQNESFRLRLEQVLKQWSANWAECLKEAQLAGEISTEFNPAELSQFLLSSWEGALLSMKASKSIAPLDQFISFVFDKFLNPA